MWWTVRIGDVVPLIHEARRLFATTPQATAKEIDVKEGDNIVPGVQTYMTRNLEALEEKKTALGLKSRIVLKDKHLGRSYATRKPDIVGYMDGEPENDFHIAVLGDVKRRRTADEFTKAEKGELESFLQDHLSGQTLRRRITGFLTDGKLIQFFRLSSTGHSGAVEELELEGTRVFLLAEAGADLLVSLLFASDTNLDLPPRTIEIDNEQLVFERALGAGASAMVYAGTYRGQEVVVKRFMDTAALHVEARMLTRLASVAVPRLVARSVTANHQVLVETPIGLRFATRREQQLGSDNSAVDSFLIPTATHFCQLIDILEQCHAIGVVHRDLSFRNFFVDPGNGTV